MACAGQDCKCVCPAHFGVPGGHTYGKGLDILSVPFLACCGNIHIINNQRLLSIALDIHTDGML